MPSSSFLVGKGFLISETHSDFRDTLASFTIRTETSNTALIGLWSDRRISGTLWYECGVTWQSLLERYSTRSHHAGVWSFLFSSESVPGVYLYVGGNVIDAS